MSRAVGAVVAVALAATLGGCAVGGDLRVEPERFETTAPRPGASPTLPALGVTIASEHELPDELQLVAPVPGGQAMWVLGPDEDGSTCGSRIARALQVWPLGGEPRPALDPELDVTAVLPRADGSFLLLDVCRDEVDAAFVGTPDDDGVFAEVTPLPLPGAVDPDAEDEDGPAPPVTTAVVPGPGALLTVAQVDAEGARVVRVAADGTPDGAPVPVDRELYAPVVVGERLWAAEPGAAPAVVDVLGDLRHAGYDQVARHPDGIVVAGRRGIAVIDDAGTPVPLTTDEAAWSGLVAVEDGVLAVLDPFGEARLVLVGPEGVEGVVAEGVAPTAPWSLGGRRVVYEVVDPVDFSTTVVVRDL